MENKKVAILFYGLSRSINKTINSIKRNLFTPLKENSIDYDIFIHTNKIFGQYHNNWANEHTDNYINEDIEFLLKPKYFIWDNQENIINSINFNDYYKKLGNWTGMTKEMTKYLIKNMCLALYSKKQVTLLFEKYKNDYDYAIIVRPDIYFNNKINVNYFNELNDNNIIIPEIDWFAGCNDRFCIAKPNIILYCGKLFDGLKEYSEKTSVISERYFFDKLKEKKIGIIQKNIKYQQIRI
jgi:hypothetical protein